MVLKNMPYGGLLTMEQLPYDTPELVGDWEWESFNHYSNNKVNVFFGKNIMQAGGYYGEIDNFIDSDGTEVWELHVRTVEDEPEGDGTILAEEPETTVQFDTLSEAIAAVPNHIATYYE